MQVKNGKNTRSIFFKFWSLCGLCVLVFFIVVHPMWAQGKASGSAQLRLVLGQVQEIVVPPAENKNVSVQINRKNPDILRGRALNPIKITSTYDYELKLRASAVGSGKFFPVPLNEKVLLPRQLLKRKLKDFDKYQSVQDKTKGMVFVYSIMAN